MKIKASCSNGANWKQVDVKSRIPKELDKLEELARNMWWAWNHDARVLFRSLDEDLFDEVGQNPVLLLERLSYEKMEELSKDSSVVRKMNDVYAAFREYMDGQDTSVCSLFLYGVRSESRVENIFRWFGSISRRLSERGFR